MLSEDCINDLIGRFSGVMDEKIKTLVQELPTKADFAVVNDEIKDLRRENQELKNELQILKAELGGVQENIKLLDSRSRNSNLIFTGLECTENSSLHEVVTDFIRNILGVEDELMIADVVRLGRGRDRNPLLVKFVRGSDISKIFGKTRCLRGTAFGVDRDYSENVRAIRGKLFQIRKEIRKIKPDLRVTVRSEFLIVGTHRFTWSDKNGIESREPNEDDDGLPRLSQLVGVDMGRIITSIKFRTTSLPPVALDQGGAPVDGDAVDGAGSGDRQTS